MSAPPSNGYPSKFTVKTNGGFPLFIPTAANGSDSTYSCDDWDFLSSFPCLCVGGSYNQGTHLGLFVVSYNDVSDSDAYIGCRLPRTPLMGEFEGAKPPHKGPAP